jgi:hypothetical protein
MVTLDTDGTAVVHSSKKSRQALASGL